MKSAGRKSFQATRGGGSVGQVLEDANDDADVANGDISRLSDS